MGSSLVTDKDVDTPTPLQPVLTPQTVQGLEDCDDLDAVHAR